MKRYKLNEENRAQKLAVYLSTEITQNINSIIATNQNNREAVSQWMEYIEGLKTYISNPQIAFDYVHRYQHYQNGAIHLVELGYDVVFIVKTNRYNQTYVYVFQLDLKTEQFGLNTPFKTEAKQYSKLDNIISEAINNYLRNNLLIA